MKIGDIEFEIHKTWYNKTKVQEDGVTHVVDPTPYTVYQFGMAKNYFFEDKGQTVSEIIKDLRIIADYLEKLYMQEHEKGDRIND